MKTRRKRPPASDAALAPAAPTVPLWSPPPPSEPPDPADRPELLNTVAWLRSNPRPSAFDQVRLKANEQALAWRDGQAKHRR